MLGNNIRYARKKVSLTQEELARMIGVKRSVISKYENGSISPKLETIEKIADALSATTDFILGLTDDPNTRLATQADMDHFGEKEPPGGWGLTDSEHDMIEKFKRLPLDERNIISAMVDFCFDRLIKKTTNK